MNRIRYTKPYTYAQEKMTQALELDKAGQLSKAVPRYVQALSPNITILRMPSGIRAYAFERVGDWFASRADQSKHTLQSILLRNTAIQKFESALTALYTDSSGVQSVIKSLLSEDKIDLNIRELMAREHNPTPMEGEMKYWLLKGNYRDGHDAKSLLRQTIKNQKNRLNNAVNEQIDNNFEAFVKMPVLQKQPAYNSNLYRASAKHLNQELDKYNNIEQGPKWLNLKSQWNRLDKQSRLSWNNSWGKDVGLDSYLNEN